MPFARFLPDRPVPGECVAGPPSAASLRRLAALRERVVRPGRADTAASRAASSPSAAARTPRAASDDAPSYRAASAGAPSSRTALPGLPPTGVPGGRRAPAVMALGTVVERKPFGPTIPEPRPNGPAEQR